MFFRQLKTKMHYFQVKTFIITEAKPRDCHRWVQAQGISLVLGLLTRFATYVHQDVSYKTKNQSIPSSIFLFCLCTRAFPIVAVHTFFMGPLTIAMVHEMSARDETFSALCPRAILAGLGARAP